MPGQKQSERHKRLETANQIIRMIASHGRRFFSQDGDHRVPMENPRISRFEFAPNGRLWFIDKYTQKRIFVHYEPRWRSGKWRGFSEGGTLQNLVEKMRDYILHAKEIDIAYFGPFPEYLCRGDLWGYGEAMKPLREQVIALLGKGEQRVPVANEVAVRELSV